MSELGRGAMSEGLDWDQLAAGRRGCHPEPMIGTIQTELGFSRATDVRADHERVGLLRARTQAPGDSGERLFDRRACLIRDWSETPHDPPSLYRHGFDCVNLSSLPELQAVLARVRETADLPAEDVAEIRRRLSGQRLRLTGGSEIKVLFIAPEGFILRIAGPNGLAVGPPGHIHDAATGVHADQDILGTPLKQMMRGAAPWMFRHDAPDSRNHWSPLLLLNLWIPLQQITRPLVLMDKRTLDRRAHQLRYGLPTDDFLDRNEERRVNDIWTFLHDDGQQWYFHPEMGPRTGYVFETLGTPHASCIVPGEERAEVLYRELDEASDAIRGGDVRALTGAIAAAAQPTGAVGTHALQRAIGAMEALLEEARKSAESLCHGQGRDGWLERARHAMVAVVRKSIEMRVVALRTPTLRRRA